MNCLIADDEPIAREILESYIADTPGLTLVSSCISALSALEVLKSESVHILFLDVNMPKLTGIELLHTLENPPLIVLTTAYPDYALESYELNVTDYLLKPFSFERFLKAVRKAEKKMSAGSPARDTDTIMIRADKKTWPVEVAEILFVESAGDYVTIHTGERKITTHSTLREMENRLLPPFFLRVHKSWIVSKHAIQYMEGNLLVVAGTEIPIGKTYREAVQDWLGE